MTKSRAAGSDAQAQSTPVRVWRPAFATAILTAAVLAACGGGGGGGGSTSSTGTVKVSGVAATGAALPGATVAVACAAGTGTATGGADGSFTITVTDGALPCVLEATSGGTTLHGVALGTGPGTVTAHITTLTEMALANVVGQDPKAFFASIKSGSSSLSTLLTDAALADASAQVIAALKAAGVDTTALTDLLKGDLKAGTGTGYDGVLDALGAKLRLGGSTIADLAAVLAASSAAGTADSGSTGMLPVAALLQTKAATCGALRSGDYWRLIVKPSTLTGPADPVTTASKVTVDAAAAGGPLLTNPDTTTETLVAAVGQTCRFTGTTAAGGTDYMVSPSGIAFARSNGTGGGDTSQRLEILLPVQTVAVSALAGKWNGLGWYPRANQGGAWTVDGPVATIGADGKWSAVCNEDGLEAPEASCLTTEPLSTGFTVNAAGGFDALINGLTHRGFAYQSGNGTKLIVLLHANGGAEFLTPVRNRPLQSVGAAWSAWDIRINSAAVSTDPVGYYGFQITAVDATAKTESRKTTIKTDPGLLNYAQTFTTDSPRPGWSASTGGSVANSAGGTTVTPTVYALRTGLGFTPFAIPGAASRLGISVNQPQ